MSHQVDSLMQIAVSENRTSLPDEIMALKTQSCHDANFVVTSGTGGYHNTTSDGES